ncbi:hypothetical protein EsH8_VIII_000798 [Colletotrichum jinshuiense]
MGDNALPIPDQATAATTASSSAAPTEPGSLHSFTGWREPGPQIPDEGSDNLDEIPRTPPLVEPTTVPEMASTPVGSDQAGMAIMMAQFAQILKNTIEGGSRRSAPGIKMPAPGTTGAPTFDGCNVSEFVEKFEALAGLSRYSEKDMATAFPWYLPEEHRATVKNVVATGDWEAVKTFMIDTYGPLDEELVLRPNKQLRDLIRGPLIQDDDLTTAATLFQKIDSVKAKAKARGKSVISDPELIELVAKRFTENAFTQVAQQLGMKPGDLFEEGRLSSFKPAMLSWISGKARYKGAFGDTQEEAAAPPTSTTTRKTVSRPDQGKTSPKTVPERNDVTLQGNPSLDHLAAQMQALTLALRTSGLPPVKAYTTSTATRGEANYGGFRGDAGPNSFRKPGFVPGHPDRCWYDGCDSRTFWRCPQLLEDKSAGLIVYQDNCYKYGLIRSSSPDITEVPDSVIWDARRSFQPDRPAVLAHIANNARYPGPSAAARTILDNDVGRPMSATVKSMAPELPTVGVRAVKACLQPLQTHTSVLATSYAKIDAATRSQAQWNKPDQTRILKSPLAGRVEKSKWTPRRNSNTDRPREHMPSRPDSPEVEMILQPTREASVETIDLPSVGQSDQVRLDENSAAALAVTRKLTGSVTIPFEVAFSVWPAFKQHMLASARQLLNDNGYRDIFLKAPDGLLSTAKPSNKEAAEAIMRKYEEERHAFNQNTTQVKAMYAVDPKLIDKLSPNFVMPHLVLEVSVGGDTPDQNAKIQAILDTGAEANILSRSYATKHNLLTTPTMMGMQTFTPTAAGRSDFDGAMCGWVWVGEYKIPTTLFIADDRATTDPLLLGGPFQVHSRLNFEYDEDLISAVLTSGTTRLHIPVGFINLGSAGDFSSYFPQWDKYVEDFAAAPTPPLSQGN